MNHGLSFRRWLGVASVAGTSALVVSACSPAAWDTTVDGTLDGGGVTTKAGAGCDTSAPKKLEAMDVSGLAACCADGATGAAHCVPTDKVPTSYRKAMAPCTGGSCIPDALIKSGGAAPPTCKSQLGEGRCLSVCIPNIAAKKDLLQATGCTGADEKCAPCVSPLDNMPTGACDIGQSKPEGDGCSTDGGANGTGAGADGGDAVACPYTGPLIDVTKFPACDPAGARCVPVSQVPAAQRAMLKKCDSGLCVPDPILAHKGQYIPPTCNSVAGNEGRCLHISLPVVTAKASSLPQDICAADEKCVPCTDPVEGKETGACKIACDPGPKKPAVPFPSCCGGLAKCVPSTSVPAEQLSKLNSDGCSADNKCVPTEMLTGAPLKPQKCTPGFFAGGGAGVCLSKCLEFGFFPSLVLGQETCDADHICAPCLSGGKPTGAPGCN